MTNAAAIEIVAASATDISQKRLLGWMLPALMGMFAMFNAVQQIILPAQIQAIDPVNKVGNLGLVLGIAAATSVLGLLAGGAISDRTTGRWGRRTPSMIVSAIAAAAVALALATASTLSAVVWLIAVMWFALNYYQGAITAMLPDRVPLEHRGIASSVMALGIPAGAIVGVSFAGQVSPAVALASIGAFMVLATLAFAIFAPEPHAHPIVREAGPRRSPLARLGESLAGFRSYDFTLVFIARALMFFAIFLIIGYTYYIVQDYVGTANLPGGNVQAAVGIMISLQMIACILSSAVSGWLSDRWGRPKIFVGLASIGIAAAFAIPAFSASWPAMVAMQTLAGLFFGAYMAVDLAVVSLVLPDPDAKGRDMAIVTIGGTLPQVVSPMIAAAIIAQFGYLALFASGALCALGAGIAIFYVRSVR